MQHLIPQTLRDFQYYERKLPLYLRNDESFVTHFKLWYELMMGNGDDEMVPLNEFKGVSPTSDLLLHLLNIHDANFLTTISQLKDYDDDCDILDMLGNLFGLNRTFSFDYYESSTSSTKVQTTVALDDVEFLTLIKAQIIRNYCDGSYEQAMQYYTDVNLQILLIYSDAYNASVDAYFNDTTQISDNIKKLFKGGFLTIEHLGIHYTYTVVDLVNILVWSKADGTGGNAVWANDTEGGLFVV